MKITFGGIDAVFENEEGYCWSLIIENPRKMREIISELVGQLEGYNGDIVLSEENKPLCIDKKMELISQFIPFDLNRKTIISKITGALQEYAAQGEYFLQVQELLGKWEKLCLDIAVNFPGDINFTKISAETIFKAAGIEIENEYESLAEKLLDYFELVEAYDDRKLFVLLNLRSFLDDEEMQMFLREINRRGYEVMFIENTEREQLQFERRFIVDADLCNIC